MRWYNGVSLLAFYVFYIWVLGGMVFSALEGQPDCNRPAPDEGGAPKMFVDFKDCGPWNLYNSSFFAFTAIATIGYGRMAPVTQEGRGYCIVYCLLGVPLNAIVVLNISLVFRNLLVKTIEAVQEEGLFLAYIV